MLKITKYAIVRWLPIDQGIKLRWIRRLMDGQYNREMKVVRATQNAEQVEKADDNWRYEFYMHADAEQSYYSRKLLERARHLRVLVPTYYEGNGELADDYDRSTITGTVHLTLQGENKVRAAIREEEKHRSEKWARRLPYLAALTGVIGAVTGLVAVLEKLRP